MALELNPHRLLMVDISGPVLTPDERAFFAEYKVGGICLFSRNFCDRVQAAELTTELRDSLGPNLIIATDQEGGGVVRALDVPYSPGTMLLGAADNLELTHNVAAATARGLRAIGVNINFAPVADVNNNPRNPVIGERSFGSDPEHVAEHVAAYVRGLQSEGVAATVKHFPGHGDTDTDSHLGLPTLDVPLGRLQEVELVPFKKAFGAGVACVMSYHGRITALDAELPATLSRTVMTDLLRRELGFEGVSFTDALEMHAVADLFSPAEAVVRSLIAGIDMPLFDIHTGSLRTYEVILKEVERALTQGHLDEREVGEKLQRLHKLARTYPAQPDPQNAWREGDEALLADAARRGVIIVGNLPEIGEEISLAIIAAGDSVGGAASDVLTPPTERLVKMLRDRGLSVNPIFYKRAEPDSSRQAILSATARYDATLFVSTSRTRMERGEVDLANAAAQTAQQNARNFVHIALWNPYHVSDLPGPTIVSFGFREGSLEAVADILTRRHSAQGRAPIPLWTRGADA